MSAPAANGRVTIPLCYAGMVSIAIGGNLTPLFLTLLAGEFTLSLEQLGRIGAVLFAGMVSGLALSGPLADRHGPRYFAVGGHLFLLGGLALLGAAPAYTGLLAAVLLMGLGIGSLDMVLSPIVSALRPATRTASLNRLHASFCFGVVAIVSAVTLALRSGLSWRTVAWTAAAWPAAMALAFARAPLPELFETAGQGRIRLRTLLRERGFLAAMAAMFCTGAGGAGVGQWLPAFAERALGLPRAAGGMALLAMGGAMALGRLGLAELSRRHDPVRWMLGGAVASALLAVAGAWLRHPWAAVAMLAAVGFTAGGLWPGLLAATANRFPGGGGSMFGFLAAAGNLGCLLMPWIIGVISDWSHLRTGLSTVVIPFFLYAVLVLRLRAAGHA